MKSTSLGSMRTWCALAVLSLLAIACAPDSGTEVAGVTITAAPAADSPPPDPIEFDEFVELEWTPGLEYRTNSFLVPVAFVVDQEGWTSRGAGPRFAALWFDEDLDDEIDATLTLMAYRPAETPDDLVTDIVLTDGVRQLSPAVERFVGDHTAVVLDVEGEPDPQSAGLSECSVPAAGRYSSVAGHQLFADNGSFGIPACYRSRVWILQAGGSTLTLIGVATDDDEFDRLMEMLEGVLASSVTFSG